MKSENLSFIYFSPTLTTGIVLEEITRALVQESPIVIDITKPAIRNQPAPGFEKKVVLMGPPVYAGRIPKDAINESEACSTNACSTNACSTIDENCTRRKEPQTYFSGGLAP